MTERPPVQILLEICDLVDSEMAMGIASLPGSSFFAEELKSVQQPGRRDFFKDYVCESIIALLLGVMDQARCIALCLDSPGVAVSPYVLVRSLLEYSYKITYIADPLIEPEERICRSLRLFVTDCREYEKMPQEHRSQEAGSHASSGKELAICWYRELTGKELKTISTKAVMDSVWEAGLETLEKQGLGPNKAYETGYRTGSVIAHGNTWAIRHFCLEVRRDGQSKVLTLRLPESVLHSILILAARVLQMSFGFVCQFGRTLPASAMNKMEKKIYELETLRAAFKANES